MALSLTTFFGCQSATEKVESAQENARDAKSELREAREDAVTAAATDEWKEYKLQTRERMEKNDLRIAELRARRAESGKVMDNVYSSRIDALQKTNKDLQDRLDNYDRNGGDWDKFKREFSYDLDELGKALDGFTDEEN